MSIRNKLILMLAIPLAALAIVGALGFRGQSSTARDAADALQDDEVVQTLNTAIKAIGAERLAFAEDVRGLALSELRQESDIALEAVIQAASDGGYLDAIEGTVLSVDEELTRARFTGTLLDSVFRLNRATADLRTARNVVEVDYPSPDSFAEALAIDMAVDIADRQDSIWLEYIASDTISADLAQRLQTEIATTELLRTQILAVAPPAQTVPLNASLGSEMDADLERAGIVAIDRFSRSEPPLPDSQTLAAVVASHDDWHGHAVRLQGDVQELLADSSGDAKDRQNLFALLATLGLIVLFGLIYVVYRSVVRPLDELLAGAEDVAANRLPTVVAELRTIGSSDENVTLEPLPRETDDELGSLVDAFNDVQLTAFDLAVEQARSRRNTAEMFVNLGRRNQKLLQRMLAVISDLEHDEKSPDKLEQLFQLDHMTTRMRRNAESLLVVAGTKSPRQWAKAVPAADVVRSALAEVQDYHRVDILSLADAPMAGNAVADVTHLLAELLENSLQFSEPETRISVSSRWTNGNYRIVITDQGFGMTPDELEENNRLIANPPPPDQAPTRFLGLFVVGHLADRHGIDVVLTDATIGGTDARVTIPGSVMTDATQVAAAPESLALPTRSDSDALDAELDSDLDAELAKLTAESDLQIATTSEDAASADVDLDIKAEESFAPPQSSETPADIEPLPDLPVRSEALVEEPNPFTDETTNVDPEPAPDLPVRGTTLDEGPNHFTDETTNVDPEPAPQTFGAPRRGETVINFDEAPLSSQLDLGPATTELPAPPAAMPAPVAEEQAELPAPPAAMPAPVAEEQTEPALPVRGETPGQAPAAPAPSTLMGLPQRTPNAALNDVAEIPRGNLGSPTVDEESEEDINAAASHVGSMFSAFQAGIQRTERSST